MLPSKLTLKSILANVSTSYLEEKMLYSPRLRRIIFIIGMWRKLNHFLNYISDIYTNITFSLEPESNCKLNIFNTGQN